MNYLKSYKIFESDSNIDSKLNDCLVELFDYGFEIEHIEEGKPRITFLENPQQLLRIKLFKIFPKSVGNFSNYLEGDFDKDNFGPGDKNPGSREYMISNMHIEGEIVELVDDASHKIINTYIPEANRGEYIINEYVSSMEDGPCVVVLLKFFK